MNKLYAVLVAVLVMGSASTMALSGGGGLAPINWDDEEIRAGFTPDDVVWFFEVYLEKGKLLFASPAQRVQLRLDFAEERISEAKIVLRAGNENAAIRALRNMREHYQQVTVDAIVIENDVERVRAEWVIQRGVGNQSVALQQLGLLLTQAPEEAREGLSRAYVAVREAHSGAKRDSATVITKTYADVWARKENVDEFKRQVGDNSTKEQEKALYGIRLGER